MSVVHIDRFDDPRLDAYRSITDAELMRLRGFFVAEGRIVVRRMIEAGHRVVSVLVNAASYSALGSSVARLPADAPVYVCDTEDFAQLTGFNLHRGCLALVERPVPRTAPEVAAQARLLLILEGVADADNVGSAFRNAAAFGASVLLSPSCCDPLYRKAIRTSMGSVLLVPYARMIAWPSDLAALKSNGFTVVALTPRSPALDLAASRTRGRAALLIGTEGTGLSAAAEQNADLRVRIPISPSIDSLNVATAAGIALYHFSQLIPDP
jgi:tRNA G18 (ribose-2'-O)-methylase SpoU